MHVTRKHQLHDVCQTLLGQIYQLPNIEISEAFLKLREQARCHLRSSNDLQAGLDVINSTDLMYFSMPQKAEFSTLKGIFNAALGHPAEANENFSAALTLELNLPKTWQEWAKFNDNMFSETNDVTYATQAVACYLQAAGMFLSKVALFFRLRTTRDEMAHARRRVMMSEQRVRNAEQQLQQHNGGDVVMQDAATNGNAPQPSGVDPSLLREPQAAKNLQRPGSEHIDEVVQIFKTAFPLLILSMGSMVEQLNSRFKTSPDENKYRFICMLLQEALQTYAIKHDIPLVYRGDFEADFLDKKRQPTLNEYIRRLQFWRDRYEKYSKFDDIEIPGQYTEDKDGNQNFLRIARFGHQFENYRVQGQSWKRFATIGQDNSVKTILKEFTEEHKHTPDKAEYSNLKKDLLEEVMKFMIPDNVLSKYMARTMTNPADLWLMRKQFSKHLAGTMFITYLFCLTNRLPFRFLVSRRTGEVFMSEMLPGYSPHAPIFQPNDSVPFRYTPNTQQFAAVIHQEGTIPTSWVVLDLEKQLALHGRDEVLTSFMSRGHSSNVDTTIRQDVGTMIEQVVKHAKTMGCKTEREQAMSDLQNPSPANVTLVYTATKLISAATDLINLMKMTEIYHPWF
ncbi:unnamed protein product [Peniophora sp. CBMAI 1063]|nr:unnamed protein product [Peniophora sp. CBMAI 1063]